MPDAASKKQEQRNNLWPSIRTIEEAQLETFMGVAGPLLAGIGTLGVMLGHHRSIWHVLAGMVSPDGMDPERLVPTLLAGQLAAFAIFAVQLWRGARVWPWIFAVLILASEFMVRMISESGAHMAFLSMAATAYAMTGLVHLASRGGEFRWVGLTSGLALMRFGKEAGSAHHWNEHYCQE